MASHRLPIRIYYEDTDFSGVVYHASYLRFMERGRTELLRARGADQIDLHEDGAGVLFVVRKLTIDYLKPGAHGRHDRGSHHPRPISAAGP